MGVCGSKSKSVEIEKLKSNVKFQTLQNEMSGKGITIKIYEETQMVGIRGSEDLSYMKVGFDFKSNSFVTDVLEFLEKNRNFNQRDNIVEL